MSTTKSTEEPFVAHHAQEGGFVLVDVTNKAAAKVYETYKQVLSPTSSYAVWHTTNHDGTANIRLRDDTNALVSGVPVEALSYAESGGR